MQKELDQLKHDISILNQNHYKLRKDHLFIKDKLVENNIQMQNWSETVDFYKYRIDEIKHKYNEESSDEEDLIRKVIKSQRPKNKSTNTNDLEDYLQGKHVNVEVEDFLEIDKNVRLKFDQLHKIKHKNKPVAKHIQTELTKGKDFAIQITDGEEMISHVDYRSRSMGHKDLPDLELVPNILSTEMNQVEEQKHINRTYRKGSVNEHK